MRLLSHVCLLLAVVVSLPTVAAERAANGIFLVAAREPGAPNCRQTVGLGTHPQEGGPWGVIINRPLQQRLSEVFTDQEKLKGRKDVLYFGGPVQRDGLVFLVRSESPPPRSVAVLRDVYFTGEDRKSVV